MKDDILSSPKVIAAYYRVSTATQEENQTIETQISAVKDFAAKNGYKIVKEYADDGWSGDTLVRPSLDQLRVDAKEKMWEGIIAYDPDRIARRYSYQELVMDELKEAGLEIVFVTTPAPKNSEDKILHGVKGLFAEYERAKITERFRLGKVRKVKDGHILTTEAKYGYTYIPKQDKTHGYYIINEEEARIVRMIFGWVADEGLRLRAIVRKLHELKIRPRKSKRGVWSTSTLTTLLRHKVYIGEAHWGSSYGVVPRNPLKMEKYRKIKKSSRKRKPEEEWYVIPVPKIIERELYDRARRRLEANYALAQRNRKNEYLLAGKIWCVCGRRRCGSSPLSPHGGNHLYYRCNSRIHSFPLPAPCREKSLNARIADNLVWLKIASLMSSPDLMLQQAERGLKEHRDKPHASVGDIKEIETEAQKLKDQGKRYNQAYGAALIDLEQLREYTLPLKERLAVIEGQIAQAAQIVPRIDEAGLPNENEIRTFAQEATAALDGLSFDLKRSIVLNTIEKVVGTQEKLQIYGSIPITNVSLCSNHRHGANAIAHVEKSIDAKQIPFYFEINLPPPLRRGVDYGFGTGVHRKEFHV